MSSDVPRPIVEYFEQSRVALALAAAEGDNHLVLVNTPFSRLTGFEPEDVVGRNCRLLQRDAANIEPRARLREFLARPTQPNVRTPIVNFRKDGTPFVNLLYMSRLRSNEGRRATFSLRSSTSAARSPNYWRNMTNSSPPRSVGWHRSPTMPASSSRVRC
ncbi:PAS domain-containing protein [Sphingomonas panni]